MEQLKEQVREAASAIRNWLKEPKNKWLVGTGLLAFSTLPGYWQSSLTTGMAGRPVRSCTCRVSIH